MLEFLTARDVSITCTHLLASSPVSPIFSTHARKEVSKVTCLCRGGSRGGSLGSDEPPFLAIYPILSMGSSVRSNFKEPPWALASYSKERFCLLLTYRNGFEWIVVDLQPSRTREDLKHVQTSHFNEEWAWSLGEVGVARKFCRALRALYYQRTPLSQILDPPLTNVDKLALCNAPRKASVSNLFGIFGQ